MKKNILILGANGMLGSSLYRYFTKLQKYKVLGTVRSAKLVKSISSNNDLNLISEIEASSIDRLNEIFFKFNPDYVLNCIGIIKQLDESKDYIKSIEINALFPHKLAEVCSKYSSKLIHFSTDCVFSGKNGPYSEEDIPDANDLYGKSKLMGEISYKPHLTIRTSIIGHELNRNISLVDWFLSQDKSVKGYQNAIFSGVPTVYLAEFIEKYLINKKFYGLYHLGVDPISKFKLLKKIKEKYHKDIMVEPCDKMIIDKSLNSSKLKKDLNIEHPDWDVLINMMHREYEEYFS